MINTILYIATSKDGFIADKQGGLDWLSYAEQGSEDYGFIAFFDAIDHMIMGEKTYLKMIELGEWPYEGIHTFVFSNNELPITSPDVSVYTGTPKQFLDELPIESLITRIWLVGGGELAQSFEKEGLIDEYIITILPIELKEGTPLGINFENPQLEEVETKAFKKDIIQKHYVRI